MECQLNDFLKVNKKWQVMLKVKYSDCNSYLELYRNVIAPTSFMARSFAEQQEAKKDNCEWVKAKEAILI